MDKVDQTLNVKTEKEIKEYYKNTIDQLIEDIRKTCHAMIEAKHVCNSPIELVKEAIDYIDGHYKDALKDERQRQHKFE